MPPLNPPPDPPPARGRRLSRALRGALADTTPLRNADFKRLWLATTVAAIGAHLSVVAVPVQLFTLTGSSSYVGLAGLFGLVPLVVFGLWGGAISDTMDRRLLLMISSAGLALCSFALWATAGTGNVWLVLCLYAAQQACFAVNQPTRSAVLPRLLPANQLVAANALVMLVFVVGSIAGPVLAGVLIPVIGLSNLYLLDAIALLLPLWAAWRLPPLPPLPSATPARRGLRGVADGFVFLATRRVLLVSMLVDIVAMAFGMPRAVFPEAAVTTFGDPPGGGLALGWLYASIAIGATAGGLFSGWLHRIRRQGVAVTLAVCGWGLAVVAFALADQLWLAVVMLAVGGAADMVSSVFRNTMLQVDSTDEMRGRMQGVFVVVVVGGPRLADLWHGPVADAAGTAFASAIGGVGVVVVTVLLVAKFSEFWRYRAP